MKEEQEVISIDDAVNKIGEGKSAFYHKHRSKLIVAGKIGTKVYFDLDHFIAYEKKVNKNKNSFKIVKL